MTGPIRASSRPASSFKKLIDLEPFQEGFLAAPWDGAGSGAAAQATYNGAMQLMGQWLPGTVKANSGDSTGDRRGPRLVPVPGGRRRRRRCVRRRRRRQRLRRRQGRAARDGRLPAATSSASTRPIAGAALNSGILPTTIGSEASVTDPTMKSVLEGRCQGRVRPAVPRPGDHAGARRGDQRGGRHPVRWRPARRESVAEAIATAAGQ